jgi:hypothetical protein
MCEVDESSAFDRFAKAPITAAFAIWATLVGPIVAWEGVTVEAGALDAAGGGGT